MKTALLIIIFSIIGVVALSSCTRIDTGNVGIEATLGQVKQEELSPGVYFTLFKKVHEVSAKEVAVQLYDLKPKSKDNLTMTDFDVDVYYKIDPSKAADLLVKYAGDLSDAKGADGDFVGYNYFFRQAREAAYNVAAKFPAAEMNQKRTDMAETLRTLLQEELDKETGKGWFTVTNINIRNIVTDPNIENAIRTAAQTRFEIERKNQEIELAQKEAERKKIEAEGEARANQIISQSLTDKLIEMKRIEATREFAKQGTHTVIMGSGPGVLVQTK